mmetsp:Transcript_1860/g.2682  ORF Transcript_1860/g.2682 Transcript_1860/m.2682 type:complete len:272 (-) Transcript_1860:179-994(-)
MAKARPMMVARSMIYVIIQAIFICNSLVHAFAPIKITKSKISGCRDGGFLTDIHRARINKGIHSFKREGFHFHRNNLLLASNDNENGENKAGVVSKASWYAVEAFGKIFAGGDKKSKLTVEANEIDLSKAPSSMQETLARIKLDNERNYFLSGKVDSLSYAEDCEFSDPFVSFRGRDRFVENLQNLGSFITNYNVKQLGYEVSDQSFKVKTRLMVKLELNLPWKPILAWPWGVTYSIDPNTFLITTHQESWEIEPFEGVKQIFRAPTSKIN